MDLVQVFATGCAGLVPAVFAYVALSHTSSRRRIRLADVCAVGPGEVVLIASSADPACVRTALEPWLPKGARILCIPSHMQAINLTRLADQLLSDSGRECSGHSHPKPPQGDESSPHRTDDLRKQSRSANDFARNWVLADEAVVPEAHAKASIEPHRITPFMPDSSESDHRTS